MYAYTYNYIYVGRFIKLFKILLFFNKIRNAKVMAQLEILVIPAHQLICLIEYKTILKLRLI